MKLLTRTGLWYITISLLLFALAGVAFYLVVKADIEEDFTENLFLERERIEAFVKDSLQLPTVQGLLGEELKIERVNNEFPELLCDTTIFNQLEEELQEFRLLSFPVSLNTEIFAVTIIKPHYQSEDLVESIVIAFAMIAACTLLILASLNWWLSRRMWKPFYNTLHRLGQFELNKGDSLNLSPTGIHEFNELNESINLLTDKVSRDYRNLKEFSENASHELQTPLAVVRAKLELLINQNQLTSAQSKLLAEANEAIHRLTKLNQSLLLLSKIENDQFEVNDDINFSEMVNMKLEEFAELIDLRSIAVEASIEEVTLKIHPALADVLLSNLISNSIRHNKDNGSIHVWLTKKEFKISNTGAALMVLPEHLFQRFRKGNDSSENNGLGLAIVKSICDSKNWKIGYEFENNIRSFIIQF